jgi:hypothetical protein
MEAAEAEAIDEEWRCWATQAGVGLCRSSLILLVCSIVVASVMTFGEEAAIGGQFPQATQAAHAARTIGLAINQTSARQPGVSP